MAITPSEERCPDCGWAESNFIESEGYDDLTQEWVVQSTWYECPSCLAVWGIASSPDVEETDWFIAQ